MMSKFDEKINPSNLKIWSHFAFRWHKMESLITTSRWGHRNRGVSTDSDPPCGVHNASRHPWSQAPPNKAWFVLINYHLLTICLANRREAGPVLLRVRPPPKASRQPLQSIDWLWRSVAEGPRKREANQFSGSEGACWNFSQIFGVKHRQRECWAIRG